MIFIKLQQRLVLYIKVSRHIVVSSFLMEIYRSSQGASPCRDGWQGGEPVPDPDHQTNNNIQTNIQWNTYRQTSGIQIHGIILYIELKKIVKNYLRLQISFLCFEYTRILFIRLYFRHVAIINRIVVFTLKHPVAKILTSHNRGNFFNNNFDHAQCTYLLFRFFLYR